MEHTYAGGGDYLSIVRNHGWLIAVCTIGGLLLGAAAIAVLPKSYAPVAQVLVRPAPADAGSVVGGRTSGTVNLDTEAQIATSDGVALRAAEILAWSDSPSSLASDLSIGAPANASVLNFRYQATDPEFATAAANAFAQAYLEEREQTSKDIVAANAKVYSDLLASLSADLAAATNEADQAVLRNQQIAVGNDLREALSTSINPGRLIEEATPPKGPTTPTLLMGIAAGLGLGLLSGLSLAAWRSRRGGRAVAAADVRELVPARHYVQVQSLQGGALRSLGELLRRSARQGQVSKIAVMAASAEGLAAANWVAEQLSGVGHSSAAPAASGDGRAITLAETGMDRRITAGSGDAADTGVVVWPAATPIGDPLATWDAEMADEIVIVIIAGTDKAERLQDDIHDMELKQRALAVVTLARPVEQQLRQASRRSQRKSTQAQQEPAQREKPMAKQAQRS